MRNDSISKTKGLVSLAKDLVSHAKCRYFSSLTGLADRAKFDRPKLGNHLRGGSDRRNLDLLRERATRAEKVEKVRRRHQGSIWCAIISLVTLGEMLSKVLPEIERERRHDLLA